MDIISIIFIIVLVMLFGMIVLMIYGFYDLLRKCKKKQKIELYDTESSEYTNSELSNYSYISRQYYTKEEYETIRKQILNLKLQ